MAGIIENRDHGRQLHKSAQWHKDQQKYITPADPG